MRRLRLQFVDWITNLSLKRKLAYVIGICIFLLSLSGFLGSLIVSRQHLLLLQEAVASNLSYSSSFLAQTLDEIEDMSASLSANSTILENLITADSSESSREQTAAYQALTQSVSEFYDLYKSSFVDYITLSYSRNTIHSNFLGASRTPEETESLLLSLAEDGDGRPVWVFQYAQSDGIYLTRLIRNPQDAHFRSLGVLIVSIDLNKLFSSLNQQDGAFPNTRYFLSDDQELVYWTDETAEGIFQQLESDISSRNTYEILTVNRHKYFVYSVSVPGHDLTCTCYLSYDSIIKSSNISWGISMFVLFIACLIALVISNCAISSIDFQTRRLLIKMQTYNTEQTSDYHADPACENRRDEFGMLNTQFDLMAERINKLILDNYVNELWKKDAQLKMLEQQIQPHFLYNTLESINWRAKSAGNREISSMVEALGRLLRASLSRDNDNWTLQEEMEITTSYITIQKFRFGEQLDYVSHCDPALYCASLPRFTIQPLVENAVLYGLEENIDTCHIEVSAVFDESMRLLLIYVKNNGSAFEENLLSKLRRGQTAANGFGVGLINIDERIKLMFGDSYGLNLYNENDQAVAQITIPCLREREEAIC